MGFNVRELMGKHMMTYEYICKELINQLTDEQLGKCLSHARLTGRALIGTFGRDNRVALAEFDHLLEEMSRRLQRLREENEKLMKQLRCTAHDSRE